METISITSTRGMINSGVQVYTKNDGSNGLLLTADGSGEVGSSNHAGGSIPQLIESGGTIPNGLFVINVQKPNDGQGSFQAERYMDALDWAIKTYPKLDQSRIYATGLSLSGGAISRIMGSPSFAKKFAALVPVCGTKDVTWQELIVGVKASPTPFRAYGSSEDSNAPTREAFTTYKMVADGGFDSEKILSKNGKFIDLLAKGIRSHSAIWPYVYNFGNTDFWGWLAAQKRTDVVTTGGVTTTTGAPTKKLVSTVIIPALPEKKINIYLNPDGSYSQEVV